MDKGQKKNQFKGWQKMALKRVCGHDYARAHN